MKRKYNPIPTKLRVYENNEYLITQVLGTGVYKISPKDSYNDMYATTLEEAAKIIGVKYEDIVKTK